MQIIYPNGAGKPVTVSDEDYPELNKHSWIVENGYAIRRVRSNGIRKRIYMHNEIMKPPPTLEVDHISGDTLDNRRENLRLVGECAQHQNRAIAKNNTTGCTGVTLIKKTGLWKVNIFAFGKRIHIGHFANYEDAVMARKEAEQKYFGQYARQDYA